MTKAYAAHAATTPLAPFSLQRRDPQPLDVEIDILYCGVCHSDLHQVRDEWHNTVYPCVPGHEIVGRVIKAGSKVTKFIPETQEMLDFCVEHGITSDIEMIKTQQVNEAYERLLKSDVKHRFVIDMASLKNA